MQKTESFTCGIALSLALIIAASGPGARFGIWDYSTGFTIIRNLALPTLLVSIGALVFLARALFVERRLPTFLLIAFMASSVAGTVKYQIDHRVNNNPYIHDITTDFDNPPEIVYAAGFDRRNPPEYLGDTLAPESDKTISETQKIAFPDIVAQKFDTSMERATKTVRSVLRGLGIVILREERSGDTHTIEAEFTSLWFGFKDDFVVRLERAGSAIQVDVRGKSRIGTLDLGANAARIRKFQKRLEQRLLAR